jgi:hypothetical protein
MATASNDPARQIPAKGAGKDTGRPEDNSGAGRVDVTGKIPEGIHVDPDITEGHPGRGEWRFGDHPQPTATEAVPLTYHRPAHGQETASIPASGGR